MRSKRTTTYLPYTHLLQVCSGASFVSGVRVMFLQDAASCTTSAPQEQNARFAMRTVLTQALIEKLPVPVKVEDHRDVRLKGLVLRVSPSGVKSFYCEYARGKRIWLGRADALGLAEARESARVVLSGV